MKEEEFKKKMNDRAKKHVWIPIVLYTRTYVMKCNVNENFFNEIVINVDTGVFNGWEYLA